MVEAAFPNPQAEVWLLKGAELAGAGYRPDDFLIVDVTSKPQRQHFVIPGHAGFDIRTFECPLATTSTSKWWRLSTR